MEIAIAESVVKNLAAMIIDKASREIALLSNHTEDFNWLKQLTSIQVFLAEANSMAGEDDLVKIWLHRIRDVAWDAEDIVQEYALRPLYASNVTPSCVCDPRELIFRRRMGKRIQNLNERIRSITEDGEKLKNLRHLAVSLSGQPSGSGAARQENSCLMPSDSHPVGIEGKVDDLIRRIEEPDVRVIAIVGIGGAGKTFLARNVFHRIKEHYEHKIWLSISQSYSIEYLKDNLLSQMDNANNIQADFISQKLRDERSLIVLDEVWTRAGEINIIESLGLPVGPDSQCKVVVTTRSEEICNSFVVCLYKMELLSKEESRQLLYAYAFRGDPPRNLDEIAGKVVKKCGGLPLALKIIGASLYGCMQESQWQSKLNQLEASNLKEEIYPSSNEVRKILRLSYDSLSSTLKLCFSYLSFFAEDEKIDPEYLINLWIAEGFIQFGEYDQCEVGWRYFYKLANLCLLEVEEDEYLDKHCTIHDLLRDMVIAMSKEQQCKFNGNDSFGSAKRIFLHEEDIQKMATVQSKTCPRSLRALSLSETRIEKIEKKFVCRIRSLRVLDLSKTNISTLPRCVRKLSLLNLLNLSNTKIRRVPKCVRCLKSLLFLDLSGCGELKNLPKWISKLKSLRHLNIIGCKVELLSRMPKGISELVDLRVLRSSTNLKFSIEEDGFLKLKDFAEFTSLQELSIEVNHETQLKSLQDGTFSQPLQMRRLSVNSTLSDASAQPPNLSAMHYLQTLQLKRFAVPSWICNLTDLVQLSLINCDCRNYPELHALPNLKKLTLNGNTTCENLAEVFEMPSGFLRLRFLNIMKFSKLMKLPDLDSRRMAVLEEFYAGHCPLVKDVPEGLECLTKLRKFYYTGRQSDGLNKGKLFWDDVRERIYATRSWRVEIIESFV